MKSNRILGLTVGLMLAMPAAAFAGTDVVWQDLDAGTRNGILAAWKQQPEEKRGPWIEFRDKTVADMSSEQKKQFEDKAEKRLEREKEHEKKIEVMRKQQEKEAAAAAEKAKEEAEKRAEEDAKKAEVEAEKQAEIQAKEAEKQAEEAEKAAEAAAEKAKDDAAAAEEKKAEEPAKDEAPAAVPGETPVDAPPVAAEESKTDKVKGLIKKFF